MMVNLLSLSHACYYASFHDKTVSSCDISDKIIFTMIYAVIPGLPRRQAKPSCAEWRLLKGYRSLKNQWPRKHTENTEYSQIISVSSVDSVANYHDWGSSKHHRFLPRVFSGKAPGVASDRVPGINLPYRTTHCLSGIHCAICAGRSKASVVPRPGALSARIVRPCNSTIRLAMASPNPAPPRVRILSD